MRERLIGDPGCSQISGTVRATVAWPVGRTDCALGEPDPAGRLETGRAPVDDNGDVSYSPAEVAYLLSLDHDEALLDSAGFVDSLAHLGDDSHGAPASDVEHAGVPTIARWADVRRARARVLARKEADAARRSSQVLVLRVHEATEAEVARLLGVSQPTVNRHLRATLDEILAELGGEMEGADVVSRPSACLKCGSRPRASRTSTLKIEGRRTSRTRQLGLCEACLPGRREAA